MYALDDGALEAGRQQAPDLLQFTAKVGYLGLFDGLVVVIIRLELVEQRVLFLCQRILGLIDGEVVFRDDGAIMPRLADVIDKLLALIPWKEPDDDQCRQQHQANVCGEVAPIVFRAVAGEMKFTHYIAL